MCCLGTCRGGQGTSAHMLSGQQAAIYLGVTARYFLGALSMNMQGAAIAEC